MTDELKNALHIICQYHNRYLYYRGRQDWLPYHTEANDLLIVWRKLRDTYKESSGMSFREYHAVINQAGALILNGEYPSACIKLAEIIKQLK